jgi:hypothetical protein
MANKQDSNLTGLRYAEEASIGVLGGSPVWYPLEPNSYSDFGGQVSKVARTPITPTRQRKKGTVVDLDASGGFNQDLTMNNLTRLMQGFFFANAREKACNLSLGAAAVPCTSVTAATDKFNFGADPGAFLASNLIMSSGFGVAANNLVTTVVSTDADDITVGNLLADEASPPATAKVQVVGHQFGSATSAIALNGDLVRLTDSGTTMTTLGLAVGEWVYLGDDTAGNRFNNNVGFARIGAIAAGYLQFDKVSWTPAIEAGTGKTIRIYYGTFIKNEPVAADIVRRTYQLERTLGNDNDGEMSEYITGAVPNELTINVPQADKLNVDLTFVGLDNEQRTGLVGKKSGTRPSMDAEEAINTSSDFARIQLSLASQTDATVTPLFAYATELTLTINNGVTPNKAIGVLGGFDASAGDFEVGGSMTAYFADVTAVQAVRNNSDITLDIIIAKSNEGLVIDIPLLSLGDGRLSVEADNPITLPLEQMAAESVLGHTAAMCFFPYLPTAAG